jgi:hypothetical protein
MPHKPYGSFIIDHMLFVTRFRPSHDKLKCPWWWVVEAKGMGALKEDLNTFGNHLASAGMLASNTNTIATVVLEGKSGRTMSSHVIGWNCMPRRICSRLPPNSCQSVVIKHMMLKQTCPKIGPQHLHMLCFLMQQSNNVSNVCLSA